MTLDMAHPMPVSVVLARTAEGRPDDIFLSDDEGTVTYGDFWSSVRRVAGGLRRLGVKRGDRVVLVMDNSREFLSAWFGISILGAVEVPLNPASFPSRLSHGIVHSGAAIVIIDAHHYRSLADVIDGIDGIVIVENIIVGGGVSSGKVTTFDQLLASESVEPVQLSARDTAAILYTSGSTGLPKGVIIPHGQHFTNGSQAVRAAEITEDDIVFLCLPLHHNMAQGYGVCPSILAGATVYLSRQFKRTTFWDEVDRAQATVFPFVGPMPALLIAQGADSRPNTLRVAYGIPISKDLHQEFERRFDLTLLHGYGSTEATIVAWGPLRGNRVLGSSGQIVPEFEVELRDENDQSVEAGDVGEICIRPKIPFSMFEGYHDDDRARTALRNLWYHSGDRGWLDKDENLWFDGRTDDVVRRFGEFISATEVEEAVARHPGVELVAAYGVPSEVAGQEVMIAVVMREGASFDSADLWEWCSEQLPRFARPRFVEVVADLPMTATGKIEKHKLRAQGPGPNTFDGRN